MLNLYDFKSYLKNNNKKKNYLDPPHFLLFLNFLSLYSLIK